MFLVKLSASTVQKLIETLSCGYSRLELGAQCGYLHVVYRDELHHIYTSNEKVFNKNWVIRTATKRTETSVPHTSDAMHLHPCTTPQSGLRIQVHCVGGHTLVSVLFVPVLITLFLLKTFHYLFAFLFIFK